MSLFKVTEIGPWAAQAIYDFVPLKARRLNAQKIIYQYPVSRGLSVELNSYFVCRVLCRGVAGCCALLPLQAVCDGRLRSVCDMWEGFAKWGVFDGRKKRLHKATFFMSASSAVIWRRSRDSNPGSFNTQRFSRPPLSTTQPPLRNDAHFTFFLKFRNPLIVKKKNKVYLELFGGS